METQLILISQRAVQSCIYMVSFFILKYLQMCHCLKLRKYSSSSTIRLWPLGPFLPPGNHLSISFVVFLYFFSLQVYNLIFFLGSLLSSILCICSLQFILYCVNLSLILKMPNCFLMSLLLFFFVPKCISCHWS